MKKSQIQWHRWLDILYSAQFYFHELEYGQSERTLYGLNEIGTEREKVEHTDREEENYNVSIMERNVSKENEWMEEDEWWDKEEAWNEKEARDMEWKKKTYR